VTQLPTCKNSTLAAGGRLLRWPGALNAGRPAPAALLLDLKPTDRWPCCPCRRPAGQSATHPRHSPGLYRESGPARPPALPLSVGSKPHGRRAAAAAGRSRLGRRSGYCSACYGLLAVKRACCEVILRIAGRSVGRPLGLPRQRANTPGGCCGFAWAHGRTVWRTNERTDRHATGRARVHILFTRCSRRRLSTWVAARSTTLLAARAS